MRLPVEKLATAYHVLLDLSANEPDKLSQQESFMLLPLTMRRRLMAEQAEQMKVHYAQTVSERSAWQGGDFVDY